MDIEDLKTRAHRGNIVAQSILGICLLEGFGVDRDYAEAFRWLRAASASGAPRAAWHLGTMFEHGLGTREDLRRARELYEFAADRGEFFACVLLARLYRYARGVHEDVSAARPYYSKAASMGVDECPELVEARQFISVGPAA